LQEQKTEKLLTKRQAKTVERRSPKKKPENEKKEIVIIKVAEKLWGSCIWFFLRWPMFQEKRKNGK
jgi:hypothetical protein